VGVFLVSLPPPRALSVCLGLLVCPCVCEQDYEKYLRMNFREILRRVRPPHKKQLIQFLVLWFQDFRYLLTL